MCLSGAEMAIKSNFQAAQIHITNPLGLKGFVVAVAGIMIRVPAGLPFARVIPLIRKQQVSDFAWH
jgi:hypothetical protein